MTGAYLKGFLSCFYLSFHSTQRIPKVIKTTLSLPSLIDYVSWTVQMYNCLINFGGLWCGGRGLTEIKHLGQQTESGRGLLTWHV